MSGVGRLAVVVALLAAGTLTAPAAAAALPPCFGALARDRLAACHNPGLRLVVRPTPEQAETSIEAPCEIIGRIADRPVCAFGAPADRAQRTIALIGDSHAGNWRWPLDRVTAEFAWRGLRIGRASCPLSNAVRALPEPDRTGCANWKNAVRTWLVEHPEVSVVVVAQLAGGSGVVPARGRSEFETSVAGYDAAWRALVPSVQHIIVIRDAPKSRGRATRRCVERAMATRRPAGTRCATPRADVLDADPAATAVRRGTDPRVQLIDLTDIFCDERRCFPVIGGALVLKDSTHMTPLFAQTLGEPLLRRLQPIVANWL